MKILYFYISSYSFGGGHLKRAENYQYNFHKYRAKFKKINLVDENNHTILKFNEISSKIKKFDTIFFDVSNKRFFGNKINKKLLKKIFSSFSNKIIIIDGLNDETITSKFKYRYKCVIIPYIFNLNKLDKIDGVKYLLGIRYFLTAKIKINYEQNFNLINKKILFTSGSSDLENSTLKFLKLIRPIYNKYIKLYILIGPYFSKQYVKQIIDYSINNNLNFKFTKFKGDIYKNVFNKSLVITSSGLTKYDLFVANIPLVVFCENNSQQKLNLEFKKKFQGYCFNNLIYNKKNIIKLNDIINKNNYIKKYLSKTNRIKANDFQSIYNLAKN